ncbi:sodium/glutamate symporter [Comamonas sp. J-3]|uniref:sodium/glutamate symporter n=1 Tax=Comamonas trifloxystrobinivorans TaxID=3350256 RepID=UPI003726B3DE
MPETLLIPPLKSFTIAIVLMFVGLNLGKRLAFVQRYSIPEPVVGGFLCAAVVGLVYWWAGVRIVFELPMLNTLLLYFFAAIGLNADIKTLRQGGKPMVLLLVLASVFIVLQNLLGMGMASLFGQPHQAGLMTGSVSLTGGVGTTLAWAPTFVSQLGIGNAAELGMASNMVGLIAACLVGGPIASYLLRRHHITDSHAQPLDVGVSAKLTQAPLDYFGVLRAWLWLNVALILGDFITPVFQALGLRLPSFVGCLMAGIVLRNSIGLWLLRPNGNPWAQQHWQTMQAGLALISDLCLGLFLTMALMGLQLWVLQGSLVFVGTVLALQILLAVGYSILVVFRFTGKDYEAAVISAGFGGIALGSTATAIANMTAVTRQHGAAHRAFIIVPLVCGFFIDLVNALVIQTLAR